VANEDWVSYIWVGEKHKSIKAEDMDGLGAPWFKWERELMVKVD